jgi:hypothetical protein
MFAYIEEMIMIMIKTIEIEIEWDQTIIVYRSWG